MGGALSESVLFSPELVLVGDWYRAGLAVPPSQLFVPVALGVSTQDAVASKEAVLS